jgi:hypothetical protein
VVKKRKPAESPVARIRPVKPQLELARILDRMGQNEDATEGTYHRRKLTGMMARDKAPGLSRFEPLPESLQDGESLVRFFGTA